MPGHLNRRPELDLRRSATAVSREVLIKGSLLAPTLVLIMTAIDETGHAIAGFTSGTPAAVRVLHR
jgi:hypothetical protein